MIYSHKFNSMPRTKREVSYEAFFILTSKLVPLQQNKQTVIYEIQNHRFRP